MLRLLLPFGRPGADRLLADWLLVQHPLRYAEQGLDGTCPASPLRPGPLPPLKRWGPRHHRGLPAGRRRPAGDRGAGDPPHDPDHPGDLVGRADGVPGSLAEAVGKRDVLGFLSALFNAPS